jgi:predicted nuclease of predicted toxin-antitoxin system
MPCALVDAQLPPALARVLSENGVDADHVADIGWHFLADSEIWMRSRGHYDFIVTKDEDFLPLSQLRGPGPCVVWIRKGNCSRREMLAWFTPLIPALILQLAEGERVIEVV